MPLRILKYKDSSHITLHTKQLVFTVGPQQYLVSAAIATQ